MRLSLHLSDDMMNTGKIIRISLADEVANKIREQIVSGKLQPGQQLPTESELTQTFGVGRSTLREAVKILVHSGLLRVQQGLGMFVEANRSLREPFAQRLQRVSNSDLDEVRRILEVKIAEKAAQVRTKADIQKIKKHLDDRKLASEEGRLEAAVEADIAFHTAIALASKNEILLELYQSLATHLKKWFIELYDDTTVFRQTNKLHEQLFDSIVQQDPKKAWNAAVKILEY